MGYHLNETKIKMKFKLTTDDAQEVLHKLWVLHDTEDLCESYNITQKLAKYLINSVPVKGGIWDVDSLWALETVKGEMIDHAHVLRDIARDARGENKIGQALRIDKQAKKFEIMFT